MVELPAEFHPTDMHWFPRGHHGGGAVTGKGGNVNQKRAGQSGQGGIQYILECRGLVKLVKKISNI